MRLFKRALFSWVLLLFALVALNALRLATVPAQGNPDGEGQAGIRNGDVNCDGLLNITDPILVLNWLFGDGPEPCAIAQTDTCCTELRAELTALRATVETLAARVPGPGDIVTLDTVVRFGNTLETKIIVEVPENRRFVVTSFFWSSSVGAKLLSVTEGNTTEVPRPPFSQVSQRRTGDYQIWTSGFAFPRGADVGVTLDAPVLPLEGELYLNGYLSAE